MCFRFCFCKVKYGKGKVCMIPVCFSDFLLMILLMITRITYYNISIY